MKEVIISLAIIVAISVLTCALLYGLTGHVSGVDATAALLFCGVIVGSSKGVRDDT